MKITLNIDQPYFEIDIIHFVISPEHSIHPRRPLMRRGKPSCIIYCYHNILFQIDYYSDKQQQPCDGGGNNFFFCENQ